MTTEKQLIQTDIWDFLQSYTSARIARGRAGHSLPTRELLRFQADHAQARDAVHSSLDLQNIQDRILHETIVLQSKANSRAQYLQRPDWGRQLSEASKQALKNVVDTPQDIAIVIADGLSANAVNTHAIPVVNGLLNVLIQHHWRIAPIALVEQGRVAIADEIASAFKAEIVLILIGERPGLSSPDSMGAYLTYQPSVGITDERRNCVSNIRPEGLNYPAAIEKILYLLTEMKTKQISGVNLKDEMQGKLLY